MTLDESLELPGTVIGLNEVVDLAVVRVELQGATVLTQGSSERAQIGEEVWAVGFPVSATLGEEITVTRGIISSKRLFDGINYLQIDASINPGSSGGPLINRRGEVLGVSTFIIEQAENIGFALAIDDVKAQLESLMGGEVVLAPPPQLAPLVTYTDPDGEWSIQYPEDWVASEFEEDRRPGYYGRDSIRFTDPDPFREEPDLEVNRFIGQTTLVETARELLVRVTKDNEAFFEGYAQVSIERIEMDDGRIADIAIATSGSESGPQFYWVELFTVSTNDDYYVLVIASELDWQTFQDQYVEIVKTLKIKDPP